MNLPLIGSIDLKSVLIGGLIVWFVIPWVMGMLNRPATSKAAA